MKYIETDTIKTRKALVEEVYNKMIQAGNKHTRAEITEMSNLVFDTISEWMSNKDKIAIRGIGTFSPCWREHAVYNFSHTRAACRAEDILLQAKAFRKSEELRRTFRNEWIKSF